MCKPRPPQRSPGRGFFNVVARCPGALGSDFHPHGLVVGLGRLIPTAMLPHQLVDTALDLPVSGS